jgi:hypothetical protein
MPERRQKVEAYARCLCADRLPAAPLPRIQAGRKRRAPQDPGLGSFGTNLSSIVWDNSPIWSRPTIRGGDAIQIVIAERLRAVRREIVRNAHHVAIVAARAG